MLTIEMLTLAAHVTLGVVAVTMGAAALFSRKGAKTHVGAGRLFVVTMGLSSVLGAVLGLVKFETLYITFHAGILGATLVTSGVMAARIRRRRVRLWFTIIAGVNAVNALGLVAVGVYALGLPDGVLFGFAAGDYLFLFGMAAVACVNDLIVLFRAEISDKQRIAQHLWRMCIGFFIAAGSAFTGPGASAFPEVIQDSGILAMPELIIIVLMLFWLIKTRRRVVAA